MQRSILLLVFGIFFLQACTAPRGWKGSPYLYGTRPSGRLLGGDTIRVLLHKGTNVSIFAKRYRFVGASSSVGSGRFVPQTDGVFIASNHQFKLKGKVFLGNLRVMKKDGKFLYINEVPLETYLVSVLAHEMSKTWPLEALKAQAVVARTYARNQMARSKNKAYDVTADTSSQVYGGREKGLERIEQAVLATKGQILTYRNLPAQVFFHSSCGGILASASEVWKEDLPYLQVKKTGQCTQAPVYRWKVQIPLSEISAKWRFPVRSIKVTERSASKRAIKITLIGSGQKTISAADFRRKLGATRIKSTMFGIRVIGSTVQIAGRGYGHGVGLCQWGTRFMAEQGKNYRSILRYYFPGTKVSSSSPFV